jgi:hypothetical protein
MTPPIIMPLDGPLVDVAELVGVGETKELTPDGLVAVWKTVWVLVGVVKC